MDQSRALLLKETAETCISTLKNGFQLKEVNQTEEKLTFENADVSFSIVGCGSDNSGDWTVWTENNDVQHLMGDLLEWVTREKRTLSDVIEETCKRLSKFFETESDEDGDDDDDDDTMDVYYTNDDNDAINDVTPAVEENEEGNWFSQTDGQTGDAAVAVMRLKKDMLKLQKSQESYGFLGQIRGDNVFTWDVQLKNFDANSLLGRDLKSFAAKYKREPVIQMELQFPTDYPIKPPFARIIRPRFQFLTGHVTIGGSICMQMLTKSGWSPGNDIESILIQIRSEIMSDPNARLDQNNPDREYDLEGAKAAFDRTVKRYNWG